MTVTLFVFITVNVALNILVTVFFVRGSPQLVQCIKCHVVFYHSLLNIIKLHSSGPYGNYSDRHVQQFIGFPLLSVRNIGSLCGEDQVSQKIKGAEYRSHQDSRSTKSNVTNMQENINFDRNMGFVAQDTVCSDLPYNDEIDTSDPDTYLRVMDEIIKSGVPNYLQARIPLCSSFQHQYLQRNTVDYHDKALLDYIRFGFPLGLYHDHNIKCNAEDNHSSEFASAVEDYLHTECQEGALLGPFESPPHTKFTWSPLMTRPKGEGRRVILDLSFGSYSVNKNTDTSTYDGLPFKLTLPNLESILPQLEQLDQDAFLFKVDVTRAFRNVRIDPADAVHLGMRWKGRYFLHKNLAFGAIHGTAIFQRITDLVRFLMAKRGFKVHNYIDDIYGVCHRDQVDEAFQALKDILTNIRLPLNHNKVFSPCRKLDIMGICVDVKSCTFSIAPKKMAEIVRECISMFLLDTFTKRELQSLLGKLLYVSRCVSQSRRFLNRMLATLRVNHASHIIFPDEIFNEISFGSSNFSSRLMVWSCLDIPLFDITFM